MILERIVEATRQRVVEEKERRPLEDLRRCVVEAGTVRDFRAALEGPEVSLIAEVKRASPSRGDLRAELDAVSLVRSYSQAGAAAISVLTEPSFFKGGFVDLVQARKAIDLPILCKDFVIDPYQIYQARSSGSDCVLLIVAALSRADLEALLGLARQLGMSALVEVHDEQEMESAVIVGANLVGINNRNLSDFSVDLGTTSRLAPLAPANVTLVSESGIKSHADIQALQEIGVKGVLVGEMLVTSPDPGAKIRELMDFE